MMKNKIEDLRNHLFATLEALQDKTSPMDIGRAKAIADVAQVVVNSAKVEVDHLRALADSGVRMQPGDGTGFITGTKSELKAIK
jgi:hypothetical protein